MGFRRILVRALEGAAGRDRTDKMREFSLKTRRSLAHRLDPWMRSDPFVEFPKPTMTRHELLAEVHAILQPRTYLEVGIQDGASLALSRARSIGVDPAYKIEHKIRSNAQLVRKTSDEFFASANAVSHFQGVPLDLAFIDGMHLSEFALRDFINIEKLMTRTGVIVFDDMLPRNSLEASRDRRTSAWTGDVYKVADILLDYRPDLIVIPVNTSPTGTLVVVGLDPTSTILEEQYDSLLSVCEASDPQTVAEKWLSRATAVDPVELLRSEVWAEVVRLRNEPAKSTDFLDALRRLPLVGSDN